MIKRILLDKEPLLQDQIDKNAKIFDTRIEASLGAGEKSSFPMIRQALIRLVPRDETMSVNTQLTHIIENRYLDNEPKLSFDTSNKIIEELKIAGFDLKASYTYKPLDLEPSIVQGMIASKLPEDHPLKDYRCRAVVLENAEGRQLLVFNNVFANQGQGLMSKETFTYVPSTEQMAILHLLGSGELKPNVEIYDIVEADFVRNNGTPENTKASSITNTNNKLYKQVWSIVKSETYEIVRRSNSALSQLRIIDNVKIAITELITKVTGKGSES